MSLARRGAVAAVGFAVALVALPSAGVGAADGEWEMLRWGIEPGAAVTGETWTIAGTISAPLASDVITDIEVILTRVDPSPGCPDLSRTFHIRDGDDAAFEDDPTTSTTADPSTTTTTAPPTRLDEHRFRFEVVPRCNGRYYVSVVGTADRLGPTEDAVSDPLPLGVPGDPESAIHVGLRPPDVAATSAAVDGRSVTVSWEAPPSYATDIGGPPPDLVGYAIEYAIDGGPWKGFLAVGPATFSATRTLPGSEPAGNYQFRVRGIRTALGASDHAVAEGGPTSLSATVAVGAAPPPPSPPTTRRSTGGGRGGNASQGPTTTFDEGFSETIDYSELLEEGEDEATLPDDAASFLDFIPERNGSALLVPFAIAECLAVWALHLRYLARRVDGG